MTGMLKEIGLPVRSKIGWLLYAQPIGSQHMWEIVIIIHQPLGKQHNWATCTIMKKETVCCWLRDVLYEVQ